MNMRPANQRLSQVKHIRKRYSETAQKVSRRIQNPPEYTCLLSDMFAVLMVALGIAVKIRSRGPVSDRFTDAG